MINQELFEDLILKMADMIYENRELKEENQELKKRVENNITDNKNTIQGLFNQIYAQSNNQLIHGNSLQASQL